MVDDPKKDMSVAIIGMAGRFPGARNIDALWRNLANGVESITTLTDDELNAAGVSTALRDDPNYVNAVARVEGMDLFDAGFFGYSPRQAAGLDPQQRFFLECAWEVLESAGCDPARYAGSIGIFAGSGTNYYMLNYLRAASAQAGSDPLQTLIDSEKDFLATRVSYKLNLTGPSMTVQTACSTSLVAVHLACQSLLNYECDMALAGGVSLQEQKTGYLYQEGSIKSPDGHCRAYDAEAKGMVGGSGVALVALKRLTDAMDDGDEILAVIRGSAINNDGSAKVGYTAPSLRGQTEVINSALAMAGVEADSIGLLEGHGTGTVLGDAIELAALTEVFGAAKHRKTPCALGSIKTNIGHLDIAAGVAGLIKAVLCLKKKTLVPSLNFKHPNAALATQDSPFYVNTALCPWESNGMPRRAGVSSFGIGGTNAHVILEEAPVQKNRSESRQDRIFPLSARSPEELDAIVCNLAEFLQNEDAPMLSDVACTLQLGRRRFQHRKVIVAQTMEELKAALKAVDPHVAPAGEQIENSRVDRPVIFMFPGQGAQTQAMAAELYATDESFHNDVDYCARLLQEEMGIDIRQAICEDAGKGGLDIDRTLVAQPALFVVEYCLARLWLRWGIKPVAVIGHSVGEYAAACIAGVMSLEDAIRLIAVRARAMDRVQIGAMLAVPLSERELLPLLESGLDLAAVNAPSQCVVSGLSERIDAFSMKLAQQNIECRKLAVSHAFHSAMMEPAAHAVVEAAGKVTFHAPQLHYFSSVTGNAIKEEIMEAAYWGRNVRQTVRFSSALQALAGNPDQIFLEVGPGRALVGLARKILQGAANAALIASLDGNNTGRRALLNVLGQLWKEGADVDWQRMHGDTPLRRVALPTYPFKRERHWLADASPKDGAAKRGVRSGLRLPPQQWFYVPSWKTSLAPRPFANEEIKREENCWIVFTGPENTGEAVLRKLRTAQAKVVTVVVADEYAQIDPYRYALNPGEGEHYQHLLRDLQANGVRPSHVIHCWSQEVLRDASSIALFRHTQKRGYLSILYLIQACAKYIDDVSLTLIVVGNQLHCIGSEDISRPEKAPMSALAKIVRQEFPGIGCTVLDLPTAANVLDECYADWIIAEALRPPADVAVAYRGKRRMLQVFEQVEFETTSMPVRALRNKGVYLITGGMGMIGLGLADCLARACKARLILVNRTGFPEKSAWDSWLSEHDATDRTSRKIRKIQAIEAMGAEVMIATADVADEEQLRAVVIDAQDRFGAVNGIFHLAADMAHSSMRRLVENISPDDFEAQIQPKVGGFYALEKAFNGQQLDFGVLFSSNSAVVGGTGFGAYASANAFFDGVAAADGHGSDIPWITTNWDGWHSSNPTAGNTPHGQDATVLGMEEGLQALLNILAFSTAPQVIISATDLESRIDTWVRQSRTIRSKSEAQKSQAAQLADQSKKIMPRTNLERAVTAIWEEVLGIEGIGVEDNFLDLGGDSLIGLRILIRIRDKFGVDVPLSRFIAAKLTIAGLVVEVVSQLAQQREKQIVNKGPEEQTSLPIDSSDSPTRRSFASYS